MFSEEKKVIKLNTSTGQFGITGTRGCRCTKRVTTNQL